MNPGALSGPAGRLYVIIVTGLTGILALAGGLDSIISEHKIIEGMWDLGLGVLLLAVVRLFTVGERLGIRAQTTSVLVCTAGFGIVLITEGFMRRLGIVPPRLREILSPDWEVYLGAAGLSLALTALLFRKRNPGD